MNASDRPKVYRDFDQSELDRQYRGTVPDYTVYTRQYAERTRAAKRSPACDENLRYGEGADPESALLHANCAMMGL